MWNRTIHDQTLEAEPYKLHILQGQSFEVEATQD